MTRQPKTPAQRAQEQLELAERACARLAKKHLEAKATSERLERELIHAMRRRDYLAQHPDLPTHATTEGDTTA